MTLAVAGADIAATAVDSSGGDLGFFHFLFFGFGHFSVRLFFHLLGLFRPSFLGHGPQLVVVGGGGGGDGVEGQGGEWRGGGGPPGTTIFT